MARRGKKRYVLYAAAIAVVGIVGAVVWLAIAAMNDTGSTQQGPVNDVPPIQAAGDLLKVERQLNGATIEDGTIYDLDAATTF
jgi:hypothetical protein